MGFSYFRRSAQASLTGAHVALAASACLRVFSIKDSVSKRFKGFGQVKIEAARFEVILGISIATSGLHKRESTLRSRGYASLIVLLVGLGPRGASL